MSADDSDRKRGDSRDTGAKKAEQTSGNREESMKDSGNDEFGAKKPKADASSQADGTERDGTLDPASSGTTSLAGETSDSSDRQNPGGVEGPAGNS